MNLEALVRAAVAGDDWSVGDQGVVDTRERHQVGLEFGQVDIKGTIEAEAGSNRADHLSDQAIEVLKAGARNVQIAAADIVNGLVIHQEGAVGVLDGAVG